MPTGKTPMRLPPLESLRVRNPTKRNANPCFTAMSTVLGPLPLLSIEVDMLAAEHWS